MSEFDFAKLRQAARERNSSEMTAAQRRERLDDEKAQLVRRRAAETAQIASNLAACARRKNVPPDITLLFHRTEWYETGFFRKKLEHREVDVSEYSGWSALELTSTRYSEGWMGAGSDVPNTYGIILSADGSLTWYDVGGKRRPGEAHKQFRESLNPFRFGTGEPYKKEPIGPVDLILLQDDYPDSQSHCPSYLKKNPRPSIDRLVTGLAALAELYDL